MEKEFETKYVYRVWYFGKRLDEAKEAFFTNKEDAQEFAETVNGHMNKWSWEIQIEK